MPSPKCEHPSFTVNANVNRLVDLGRFTADITIKCSACDLPFRFIGLPGGVDLNGAAVSVDGTEARLAIAPLGEVIPPLDGPQGFTMRRAPEPL